MPKGGITTTASTWWLQWPRLFLISSCLLQSNMGERRIDLGALGGNVLDKLGAMLDNLTCGWRQLAHVVSEQPNLRCRWDIEGSAETCKLIFAPNSFMFCRFTTFFFLIWAALEQLCLIVYLKTHCSPEGSIFSPLFTAPCETTWSLPQRTEQPPDWGAVINLGGVPVLSVTSPRANFQNKWSYFVKKK